MADDFDNDSYDVCPGADPNTGTQTEKLMKAQGLMELLPTGILDPVKVVKRILEAQEQPSYEELIKQEVMDSGQAPQQPDPKQMELQMKAQMDQKKFALDQQGQAMKSELAQRDQQFQQMMQAQKQHQDERHEAMMTQIKAAALWHQDQARVQGARVKTAQAADHAEQSHQQKMQMQKESHQLAQRQQAKSHSTTGKSKK